MDQFLKQVDLLKTSLGKVVEIAKGAAPDTINVDELVADLSDMANKAFTGDPLTAAQLIARREAFDFVSACSRSADHIKLDRAAYYDAAITSAKINTERLDYAKAATTLFDSVKAKK